MPGHLPGLTLWLAVVASAAAAPAAVTISYAEQPLRLVRETSFYSAGRGVGLRGDDIVATNGGIVQIDAAGSTVALGPASRVWVKGDGGLVLLEGWLKVHGHPERPMRVGTAMVRITGGSGRASAVLRATAGATEVFAESGDLPVETLVAGQAARRTTLPSEQFAVAGSRGPLRVAARPSAAFIKAMPASFRDVLVPVTFRGTLVPPSRERAASYAELAPWLSGQPALSQAVQRRFDPPRTRRPAAVRPSTGQP